MVKKGEIGLAQVLNMYQSHEFLYFKVITLQRELKDFESWFPEFIQAEAKQELEELIKLEILVTTLHYAEVFAANLLAMRRKTKTFHKNLLEYRTSTIFDFYRDIKGKPISYIAKLLGYPPLCHVSGKDEHLSALKSSCVVVRERLVEISELFFTYNPVYNNYKHGFRLAVVGMGDLDTQELFIMSPIKEKDTANKAALIKLGNIDREVKLCGDMCSILRATTETFRLRVLEKKQEFQVIAFNKQT